MLYESGKHSWYYSPNCIWKEYFQLMATVFLGAKVLIVSKQCGCNMKVGDTNVCCCGVDFRSKHLTKGLWTYDWNLAKIIFAVIFLLTIQSGHKFAHVTTAQLSWHVQNCELIRPIYFVYEEDFFFFLQNLMNFASWAHKTFVKRIPCQPKRV